MVDDARQNPGSQDRFSFCKHALYYLELVVHPSLIGTSRMKVCCIRALETSAAGGCTTECIVFT